MPPAIAILFLWFCVVTAFSNQPSEVRTNVGKARGLFCFLNARSVSLFTPYSFESSP